MAIKESEIQNTICEYLAIRERQKMLVFWRQNTIGTYDAKNKSFRTPSRFSKSGIPDIIVIKAGKFIGLEVKSAIGKQSDNQKIIQLLLEANGGFYYVVRSLDDVKKIGL